jgi:selenide,water dikinase
VTSWNLRGSDGRSLPTDEVVWATSATAPAWLAATGLALDDRGFVRVSETLRSLSHPSVFAAGDVASPPGTVSKAGVFAVRQGPVLAHNLRRVATGGRLTESIVLAEGDGFPGQARE